MGCHLVAMPACHRPHRPHRWFQGREHRLPAEGVPPAPMDTPGMRLTAAVLQSRQVPRNSRAAMPARHRPRRRFRCREHPFLAPLPAEGVPPAPMGTTRTQLTVAVPQSRQVLKNSRRRSSQLAGYRV